MELENSDFVNTDVPYDFAIPDSHFLQDEAEREGVRDQVLEMSMQQQVNQELPLRVCASCGTETYEASCTCHSCKAVSDECAITGLPVAPHTLVRVALAGGPAILPTANKADFNTWVEFDGCCPLCTVSQQVNI